MIWPEIFKDGGVIVIAGGMIVEFLRRLLKGDLVLKREYDQAIKTASEAVAKADAAVDASHDQAIKTIAAQTKVIEFYETKDKGQ